jgi:hypothetical protein
VQQVLVGFQWSLMKWRITLSVAQLENSKDDTPHLKEEVKLTHKIGWELWNGRLFGWCLYDPLGQRRKSTFNSLYFLVLSNHT